MKPEATAEETIICWCCHVTEAAIRQAIVEGGAADVKAVIRLTGAMQNCNCAELNPKGT